MLLSLSSLNRIIWSFLVNRRDFHRCKKGGKWQNTRKILFYCIPKGTSWFKFLCLTFLIVEIVAELESAKDKIRQMERGKAELEEKFRNCNNNNDNSQQEQSVSFGIVNFWSLISTKSNSHELQLKNRWIILLNLIFSLKNE